MTRKRNTFFELTPEKILEAVESSGIRCTGRCLQLNSMENRVYEVEIELDEKPKNPSEKFRIVKFYRPGRWSKEQILAEHEFLADLAEYDIPVVAPISFPDGTTLTKLPDIDIFFSCFPKVGGRIPDELSDRQLNQVGRLLARLHNVGKTKEAESRLQICPEVYGYQNLDYLLDNGIVPKHLENDYAYFVEEICEISEPWFEDAEVQRVHGDCHLGNFLWSDYGFSIVDFDDMVRGPKVQDIWLLIPGRDDYAKQKMNILLLAYQEMNDFDRSTLRLIEPLRALRMVHFSAWIAKRWNDPAFERTFPEFGTDKYWYEQVQDLRDQLALITSI